jgi:LysM repeat protein
LENKSDRASGAANALVAFIMAALATACAGQPPTTPPLASADHDSQTPQESTSSIAPSGPTPPSPKARYVIVEEGRSLNGIAYSHHVSPAALAAANHLTPPYKLKIGARLLLPNSETPSRPQVAASSSTPPIGSSEREQKTIAAAQPAVKPHTSQKQEQEMSQLPTPPPLATPVDPATDGVPQATVSAPASAANTGSAMTVENGVMVFRGKP